MTALSCSLAYRADGAEAHFPPGTVNPTLCIIEGLPAAMYTISLPYHRLTRANTPASVSFRRFLSFSPWRAPARLRLKSQKSLGNPSLAGAKQFYCAEMCPGKEGPAGNTCRISKGRDAAWAHFCPAKPCLPLLTDGNAVRNGVVKALQTPEIWPAGLSKMHGLVGAVIVTAGGDQ